MANKIEYQIVGRYMDGKEVVAYHLQSLESNKDGRYTREQVCFLVGRGQVTNCSGQIYQDKVILRGVGTSLESLPVVQESTGEISRADSVGKIRKGTTAQQAMTQFMLVGVLASGKNAVGYVISNAAGQTKKLDRNTVLKLASEGRIGNARVQNYQGKVLLRGVNCNLNELPVEHVGRNNETTVDKPKNEVPTINFHEGINRIRGLLYSDGWTTFITYKGDDRYEMNYNSMNGHGQLKIINKGNKIDIVFIKDGNQKISNNVPFNTELNLYKIADTIDETVRDPESKKDYSGLSDIGHFKRKCGEFMKEIYKKLGEKENVIIDKREKSDTEVVLFLETQSGYKTRVVLQMNNTEILMIVETHQGSKDYIIKNTKEDLRLAAFKLNELSKLK